MAGKPKPVMAMAKPKPAEPAPETKPKPARPPSRQNRVGVMCHLAPDAWMLLRNLSMRRRRSVELLLRDAIDLLFEQEGMQRVAHLPPEGEAA